MWIEMSKLNSRFRQLPLQGVGEAGVFGGGNALGTRRGSTETPSYAPTRQHVAQQPFRRRGFGATASGPVSYCNAVADDRVKTFQKAANKVLARLGYHAIPEDGQFGPKTCGAFTKFGDSASVLTDAEWRSFPIEIVTSVQNCQTITLPTKIGQTAPGPLTSDVPPDKYALPWRVPTAEAKRTQADINTELVGHNYVPVPETGMLDAPTCGAFQLAKNEWGINYLQVYGKNCQEFVAPQKMPPGQGHQPVQDPKRAGMLALGLVGAGILAVGVLAYKNKKKGRRR